MAVTHPQGPPPREDFSNPLSLWESGTRWAGELLAEAGRETRALLGAAPRVLELGETQNPVDLVPGHPGEIEQTALALTKLSSALTATGNAFDRIQVSTWTGPAAEGFRAYLAGQRPAWDRAAEAFTAAAAAARSHLQAISAAQHDATRAIEMWAQADTATEQARQRYNTSVHRYNTALASHADGPAPPMPGPFVDPSEPLRADAQRLLAAARARVDQAGREAAAATRRASGLAPSEPGWLSQLAMTLADAAKMKDSAATSALSGAAGSAESLLKLARSLNPHDPYNQLHLAEYHANIADTAAGLVHAVAYPKQTAKHMLHWDQWSKDPAAAAGSLGFDLATAGFGGAGASLGKNTLTNTAKTGGREAAETSAAAAGRHGGESAVATAGREAAEATGGATGREAGEGAVAAAGRESTQASGASAGQTTGPPAAGTVDNTTAAATSETSTATHTASTPPCPSKTGILEAMGAADTTAAKTIEGAGANLASIERKLDDLTPGRHGPDGPGGSGEAGGGSGGGLRPNPDLEPATVTLRLKEGMPKREFARKANRLAELGAQGKLFKAPNPVRRDVQVTKRYRQDVINRIHRLYHEVNPSFTRALILRVVKRMSPDHVWELQLGGPDVAENLRFLDRYTNEDIGLRQIRPQIRSLPNGTPIRIQVREE